MEWMSKTEMELWLGMALLTGVPVLLAGCAGTNIETDYVFEPALYDQAINQTGDRFPEIERAAERFNRRNPYFTFISTGA